MTRKTALLITVSLTLFVMGTGVLLALNLAQSPTLQAVSSNLDALAPDANVEELLARDALYQTRLNEANATIQQANAAIATLEAERDALAQQNQILLMREATYQQAIAQANVVTQQPDVQLPNPGFSSPEPVHEDDHYEQPSYEHEEDGDD